MASDREEERQSESESSVDIRELLPRDGPITNDRYSSLVALFASHLKLRKMLTRSTNVLKLKWQEIILLFDGFAV